VFERFLALSDDESTRESSAADGWVEREVGATDLLFGCTSDVIAVLEPGTRSAFIKAAPELLADVRGETNWLTILVPWKEPPLLGRRSDGAVRSFIAAAPVVCRLIARLHPPAIEDLSYLLLHAVLNGELTVPRLCVRQIGRPSGRSTTFPLASATAVIMAHRGDPAYLRTALEFIDRAASSAMVTVKVGLDLADLDTYIPVAAEFDRHKVFAIDEPPTGPYVIRQALIEGSTEDLLVFQDSDDVSSYDRFDVQYTELTTSTVDLVGCHELEVDEIKRRVEAFRFPRDVSAALAQDDCAAECHKEEEPLLHATAMMRRRAFVNAGGLSTDQRIANDTQFMLRAYFSVGMRNSDEFLYIRRRHPHALTVAPRTAAGCELRRSLAAAWSSDFEKVKHGTLSLAASSLRVRPSARPHTLQPLAVAGQAAAVKTAGHLVAASIASGERADELERL